MSQDVTPFQEMSPDAARGDQIRSSPPQHFSEVGQELVRLFLCSIAVEVKNDHASIVRLLSTILITHLINVYSLLFGYTVKPVDLKLGYGSGNMRSVKLACLD